VAGALGWDVVCACVGFGFLLSRVCSCAHPIHPSFSVCVTLFCLSLWDLLGVVVFALFRLHSHIYYILHDGSHIWGCGMVTWSVFKLAYIYLFFIYIYIFNFIFHLILMGLYVTVFWTLFCVFRLFTY
jgi:hypothetical protein